MFDISIPIAFFAGIISFFAPCVIPLLPTYIAYVTGVSASSFKTKDIGIHRKKMMVMSLFYVLGFSLIFTLLGIFAGGIGSALRSFSPVITRLGGILIILFGLEFSGVVSLPFFSITKQMHIPSGRRVSHEVRSFLLGIIFAFSWTPCVGVVLGSILAFAASTQTAATGGILLFFYSLGISIPFMIAAVGISFVPEFLKKFNRYSVLISRVSGMVLVIIGILLLTNTYRFLNAYLFEFAFKLGFTIQ